MVKIYVSIFFFLHLYTSALASTRLQDLEPLYRKYVSSPPRDLEEKKVLAEDFDDFYKYNRSPEEFFHQRGMEHLEAIRIEKQNREQKEEAQEIWHAFNNAISFFGALLKENQKDNPDNLFPWTFAHHPLVELKKIKDQEYGQKISVEGSLKIDSDKLPKEMQCDEAFLRIPHTHFYEFQRTVAFLDLRKFWILCICWKKTIFPTGNLSSYHPSWAFMVGEFISILIENEKTALHSLESTYLKEDFEEFYLRKVVEVLEQLKLTLPETLLNSLFLTKHFLFKKSYAQIYKQKIEENKKFINEARTIFENIYKAFITSIGYACTSLRVAMTRLRLEEEKLSYILGEFKLFLRDIQNLTFPVHGKALKFFWPRIDLDFMKRGIRFWVQQALKVKDTPLQPPLEVKGEESSDLVLSKVQEEAELVALESKRKGKKPEFMAIEEDSPDADSESILIDEKKYWAEVNAYHEALRQKKLEESALTMQEEAVERYEKDLLTFLKTYIYGALPIKKSKLISLLRKLYFEVECNKRGKGSTHCIRPLKGNPFFDTPEYCSAKFNVDFPHKEEPIRKPCYRFIKSGFRRVFGLTRVRIEEKLGFKE